MVPKTSCKSVSFMIDFKQKNEKNYIFNPFFFVRDASSNEVWQEQKSKHFMVYFQEGITFDFVQKTIDTAEDCYDKLAKRLGFRRFDYWTWEDRAEIYIYLSQEAYLDESGRASWSGGSVDVEKKIIRCYPWKEEEHFFQRLLRHELTHIVFREYIDFRDVSLWLDEGMAMSSEGDYYQRYVINACRSYHQGSVLHFDILNRINQRNLIAPVTFYCYAASLVHYLLEEFKPNRIRKMCYLIKEKQYDTEEALLESYPFNSLEDLDKRWLDYLNNCCN